MFTDELRSVADLLFSKTIQHRNVHYYDAEKYMQHTDCFDKECVDARTLYLESLRLFNCYKTEEYLIRLCK